MNSKLLEVHPSPPFEMKSTSDLKSKMTFKGFTAGGSKSIGSSPSSAGPVIGFIDSDHVAADPTRGLELRIATSSEKTHEK